MTQKLTKKDARKVLEVIDAGLVSGLGNPKPGEMCVMAAINYALGHEHGDSPSCVHPIIRAFDISLNDSPWSSNEARAKGMRREAIAKLGSTEIDGIDWIKYVAEQHIRRVVPIPLRICASLLPDNAVELLEAAKRCEKEGTQEAAKYAAYAAKYAAESAVEAAAEYAAEYAAYAAKYAAESAVEKQRFPSKDEILSLSAEIATEACIKFKTQGSKWLDIVK